MDQHGSGTALWRVVLSGVRGGRTSDGNSYLRTVLLWTRPELDIARGNCDWFHRESPTSALARSSDSDDAARKVGKPAKSHARVWTMQLECKCEGSCHESQRLTPCIDRGA